MNKQELKSALKPVVEEIIKEMLLKGNLLRHIVSEAVEGMQGAIPAQERRYALDEEMEQPRIPTKPRIPLSEVRKHMAEAIGKEGYANVFEGVTPISAPSSPGKPDTNYSPLKDVDPSDPGVPIDGIVRLAGGKQRWAAHVEKI